MSTLLRATLPPAVEELAPVPSPTTASASARLAPLTEPFSRFSALPPLPRAAGEETLVADQRGNLTPAQMVEQKLVSLLKGKAIPVSQIQMARSLRARS